MLSWTCLNRDGALAASGDATTRASATKQLPAHPLTISDPLSANQLGVAPSVVSKMSAGDTQVTLPWCRGHAKRVHDDSGGVSTTDGVICVLWDHETL